MMDDPCTSISTSSTSTSTSSTTPVRPVLTTTAPTPPISRHQTSQCVPVAQSGPIDGRDGQELSCLRPHSRLNSEDASAEPPHKRTQGNGLADHSDLHASLSDVRSLKLQCGSIQRVASDDFDLDRDQSASSYTSSTATASYDYLTDASSLPESPVSPKRLHAHTRNASSTSSVPRQTIIKALASSRRKNQPEHLKIQPASMIGMISSQPQAEGQPGTSSSQNLSARLADLAGRSATPSTARFGALQSPCFLHERFDDAINIDKVLEEINDDEWLSHSRLMATAIGVREVSKQLQRRPIKQAVRNVMIVTKARDNNLVHLTKELAYWLMKTPRYESSMGVNVYVDAKLRNSERFGASEMICANPHFQHLLKYWTPDICWGQPEKFDLVLTLGGDGTVLFTSWLFQRVVPPILSFSLGSLGFLTNFEYDNFKEQLNRTMGDEGMRVNLRMRFTCTVYRDSARHSPQEAEQFEVLNELVIDRGPSPYVSNLELYGDDELLTVVQADGCIFSTPTGSTAYSLSAGGSLVHPDIPAILLTPICPHTLSFRPMVLSDTLLLRVAVPRNSRATAYCSFDGKGRVELKKGDHVTIAASQYPFPTVIKKGAEWFDSVSRTLRWNTRAAQQKGWEGDTAVVKGDGNEQSNADADGDGDGNAESQTEFDIDTDSAFYGSEENSSAASPLRKQMNLLGL